MTHYFIYLCKGHISKQLHSGCRGSGLQHRTLQTPFSPQQWKWEGGCESPSSTSPDPCPWRVCPGSPRQPPCPGALPPTSPQPCFHPRAGLLTMLLGWPWLNRRALSFQAPLGHAELHGPCQAGPGPRPPAQPSLLVPALRVPGVSAAH